MAFTIINSQYGNENSVNYDPEFRKVIENHLNHLRTSNVSVEEIPQYMFYRYEGNFYGYLTQLSIPRELHWIYLRVNGMVNPNQFGKELSSTLGHNYAPTLIRPSENTIKTLQKYHSSRKF